MDALIAANSTVSLPKFAFSQNVSTNSSNSYSLSRVSLKPRSSEFWGNQYEVSSTQRKTSHFKNMGIPKIEMTISRETKEKTVAKTRDLLENCTLLAGINYTKLTVKQFQDLRKRLPESSTLLVCKNRLLIKAIEGTKFEALKPCLKGMNAFLFVHSEEIPPALKPYRDMQKEFKLEHDYSGAVFEGKFYGPEDFKTLESMPSRAEVLSKLLGVFKSPSTNLVTTLQAPARDLVLTLKAHVAKLEESG